MGYSARHIGRYKRKYICAQAGLHHVNIYREDHSKIDPYQTLEIDCPLVCSLEFYDHWILGGSHNDSGTLQVLKPFYN